MFIGIGLPITLAPVALGDPNPLEGYFIEDEYSTDRSANTLDGTPADGEGVRTVVDTNGAMAITGGNLVISPIGVTTGDPAIWYNGRSRVAGMCVHLHIVSHTAGRIEVGYDSDVSGSTIDAVRVNGTFVEVRAQYLVIQIDAITYSTEYDMLLVLRESGAFFFFKGGAFTNWTLLYVSRVNASLSNNVNPQMCGYTSTNGSVSRFYVPPEIYLPAPILSDGFSLSGITDGLGHIEGDGSVEQGGGLAWTTTAGIFAPYSLPVTGDNPPEYVLKPISLDSGKAQCNATVGMNDYVINVVLDPGTSSASFLVRWANATTYIEVRLTSTTCSIHRVYNGSTSQLHSGAITYVSGGVLTILVSGNKIRRAYNDVLIGASYTMIGTLYDSSVKIGLMADNVNSSFGDLAIFAHGDNGEYNTEVSAQIAPRG